MSFETIRDTVIKSAENEAKRITDAARKQAEQHLVIQKNTAQEESERIYAARSRAIEEEYGRRLIRLKGKMGKTLLERRNARLREVFETARERILGWSHDEYKAAMKRLVEQVVGQEGGALRVHTDDVAIFTDITSTLNSKRGPDNLILIDAGHPLPERGGFVFLGPDFEVNQSLRTILADIEHDLLPVIAKELFAE